MLLTKPYGIKQLNIRGVFKKYAENGENVNYQHIM